MAIGVCASHKIADRATLCTLIKAWAVIARANPSSSCVDIPEFVGASTFLPEPIPHVSPNWSNIVESSKAFVGNQHATKFFSFDASTIASLKANVVSDDAVSKPTRVEVVSAVIKGISELSSKYVDKSRHDEAILAIIQDNLELGLAFVGGEIELYINSWCGYKFYDVDFGWDKPLWVSPIDLPVKNFILLMDSRDSGGIDVWVYLKEKDMKVFEQELIDQLAIGSAK
ncbi:PREDICTED: BAHD acyltransferase At5g47980-like [Nicotiana attenuata]|uniref:BAHD acyltransferase At5g47980-like n=1 Tax=Nicotiana attenuata TaxID=49451 RepID=UPI0009050010|nr:PREDICTED: BAHD acyltransferase At5g47980-like [Nicotiana attenuata]